MSKFVLAICVGTILTTGVFTRFVGLAQVPANIQPDAIDTLRMYLEHRHNQDFSFFSTNWNGVHIVNQLFIALPWEITGESYWGVNLGPAVVSILCSLLLFALLRKTTKSTTIAFATAMLLLLDPWFLNFSRNGWENIVNCLGVIALLFCTLLPKQNQRLKLSVLFAIAIVSPYLYHPGKIIGLAALTMLLSGMLKNHSAKQKKIKQILLVSVCIGICWLPLLLIPGRTQLGRIETVSVLNQSNALEIIKENLVQNTRGFLLFDAADWSVGTNSRYLPLDTFVLHPILIVLFLLGLLYTLKKKWQVAALGIFLVMPVNVLSRNTPDAARSVHMLPLLYVMIAGGMVAIRNGFRRLPTAEVIKKLRLLLLFKGAFLVVVALFCVYQWQHYWQWIQREDILQVRQPAVAVTEYDRWLRDTKKQINETHRSQSLYEWRSQME